MSDAEIKFKRERLGCLVLLFELLRHNKDPALPRLLQTEVKECGDILGDLPLLDHVIEAMQQSNHLPPLTALYSTVCEVKLAAIQKRQGCTTPPQEVVAEERKDGKPGDAIDELPHQKKNANQRLDEQNCVFQPDRCLKIDTIPESQHFFNYTMLDVVYQKNWKAPMANGTQPISEIIAAMNRILPGFKLGNDGHLTFTLGNSPREWTIGVVNDAWALFGFNRMTIRPSTTVRAPRLPAYVQ